MTFEIALLICFSIILISLSILFISEKQTNNTYKEKLKTLHEVVEKRNIETSVLKGNLVATEKDRQHAIERKNDLAEQLNNLEQHYEDQNRAWRISTEKEIREDALRRSRTVMRGQATEHLAPYMMEDLNPKDYRFIGDPIDYIICVGSSDIHDKTSDEISEIILLDIKTGKSSLSKVQRRIRDAVVERRVSFMVYNTDTKTTRRWPDDRSTI